MVLGSMKNVEAPATKCSEKNWLDAPDLGAVAIEQVLDALADSNRLRIVRLIHEAGGEMACGSFSERLGLGKPTVSHHFGILRAAGIIATRTEGTQKLNVIRRRELDKRFPGLLASILKAE
jgi:DNA-binding transcriptional ArsR family regulator